MFDVCTVNTVIPNVVSGVTMDDKTLSYCSYKTHPQHRALKHD